MLCFFHVDMIGVTVEQRENVLKQASVPAHSVDQFFQEGVIRTVLVDIFISLRRDEETEPLVLYGYFDAAVCFPHSITEQGQGAAHLRRVPVCAEQPVEGAERIVETDLLMTVSQFEMFFCDDVIDVLF